MERERFRKESNSLLFFFFHPPMVAGQVKGRIESISPSRQASERRIDRAFVLISSLFFPLLFPLENSTYYTRNWIIHPATPPHFLVAAVFDILEGIS